MDTNPAATTVLCFGDSNTHGWPPDAYEHGRLPADQRWTGRLQARLGSGYTIIEEGLNGRTTDLDYADSPGGNGRAYLVPCLLSHAPLDAVVLMLGSNDLKTEFARTADDIAAAVGRLVDDVASYGQTRAGAAPAVLVVSPIRLEPERPAYAELSGASFDGHSVVASAGLAAALHREAGTRGAHFVDAATVASAGADGLHLSRDSHQRLADLLAAHLRPLAPSS